MILFKNKILKTSLGIDIILAAFAFTKPKEEAIKSIDYYADDKNIGQWLNLVKQELAAKRIPVLFFTATWCGPCKQFKKSESDPLMIDALNGVTFIMIDGDIDLKKDKISNKYGITGYPSFVRVDETGKLIKKTDGGAWDENIPANMAPVMKEFMK